MKELQVDGGAGYSELAIRLGITPKTVASRIERLIKLRTGSGPVTRDHRTASRLPGARNVVPKRPLGQESLGLES